MFFDMVGDPLNVLAVTGSHFDIAVATFMTVDQAAASRSLFG
jgi:hypothetical protein